MFTGRSIVRVCLNAITFAVVDFFYLLAVDVDVLVQLRYERLILEGDCACAVSQYVGRWKVEFVRNDLMVV